MTTLLLSTTGGHLAELVALADRLPRDGEPTVWVTHANDQSRFLLDGEDVEFVPYVGVRDLRGVLRAVRDAHRLFTRCRRAGRPIARAVSTGSGIALGYLPYLAARGVECHFVESAARISGPSLTGRLLRLAPRVRTHTRSSTWRRSGWSAVGNDLDLYERVDRTLPATGTLRVLVTLGTAAEYPFDRLVRSLAPILAPDGALARATGRAVEVRWQTGATRVEDLPGRSSAYLDGKAFTAAVRDSDLLIGHAGLGTAVAALDHGLLPVLAVRRRRHGEAGDDHQQDLLDELGRAGLAVAVEPGGDAVLEALLRAVHSGVVRRADAPPLALSADPARPRGRTRDHSRRPFRAPRPGRRRRSTL